MMATINALWWLVLSAFALCWLKFLPLAIKDVPLSATWIAAIPPVGILLCCALMLWKNFAARAFPVFAAASALLLATAYVSVYFYAIPVLITLIAIVLGSG